jgi:uncharacterized protein YceK
LKKLIALFLITTLTLSATSAVAATSTPKPSAKPTAKASAKATAKATKKPATKKKKIVKKKKKRAPKKVIPSPAAIWPPKGFTQNGEVFAKIPTAAELQGEASNNFSSAKVFLRADLRKCDEFACGAVTVASDAGCTWWEVNSTFEQIDLKTGKILKSLGSLRTVSQGTKAKEVQSIMLISEIKHKDADGKVLNNIKASGIAVSCHHDAAPDLSNRNFFTAS